MTHILVSGFIPLFTNKVSPCGTVESYSRRKSQVYFINSRKQKSWEAGRVFLQTQTEEKKMYRASIYRQRAMEGNLFPVCLPAPRSSAPLLPPAGGISVTFLDVLTLVSKALRRQPTQRKGFVLQAFNFFFSCNSLVFNKVSTEKTGFKFLINSDWENLGFSLVLIIWQTGQDTGFTGQTLWDHESGGSETSFKVSSGQKKNWLNKTLL